MEKVVASKQLRETEKERRASLENDATTNGSVWSWRWTKKEKQDWRRW